MKPTIGRIVHYVLKPGESYWVGDHRPMLITNVPAGSDPNMPVNGMVTLDPANDNRASNPTTGPFFPADRTHLAVYSTVYSEDKKPGTWHWPERE